MQGRQSKISSEEAVLTGECYREIRSVHLGDMQARVTEAGLTGKRVESDSIEILIPTRVKIRCGGVERRREVRNLRRCIIDSEVVAGYVLCHVQDGSKQEDGERSRLEMDMKEEKKRDPAQMNTSKPGERRRAREEKE